MAPADIDLFLERQLDSGDWTPVAAGESGSLDSETLFTERPRVGHYRLKVRNWAGTPNQVDVQIRFVNSAGEVGTADGSTRRRPRSAELQVAADDRRTSPTRATVAAAGRPRHEPTALLLCGGGPVPSDVLERIVTDAG
jgi:hypothetical protein